LHPLVPDPRPIPLSLLDLALVSEGRTSADALHDATATARRADELGYHRFWVAEHHNMASVASTSPAVLIAHVAAATAHIRVGSGGVMLPNHPPLVVAEQFALLDALHPGRIDLGIGRAPGTDQATAAALRRSPAALGAEDFPRHLVDLMGLLGDRRTESGLWDHFRATPIAPGGAGPEVVLLGSSDYSARLAGMLGLPFAFAHHFDQGGTLAAAEIYRSSFEPSPARAEPYLIVTAAALAADTEEEAVFQSGPGRLMILDLRLGRFRPMRSPEDAAADPNYTRAMAMPTRRVAGTGPDVVAALRDLQHATGAAEVMVTTVAHGLAARLHSLELLAEGWVAADGPAVAAS
jgi:luciferase family oxidoreductase group 1